MLVIRSAILKAGGSITDACAGLNMDRTTVYRLLRDDEAVREKEDPAWFAEHPKPIEDATDTELQAARRRVFKFPDDAPGPHVCVHCGRG